MSGKSKVVLTDYVWDNLDQENEILGEICEIIAMQTKSPAEFIEEASDCEALLNTYAGPITREHMEKMSSCKIIARYGIGVDTIDLDAATDCGIIVTNNPTYCIEEVAEHTMALLLPAARKVSFYDRSVRSGKWEVPPGKPIFRLSGSTLGLIGFGNIARMVAERAVSFGMKIIFSDPFVEDGQFEIPARKVELEELYKNSDYISVHPPLMDETRGMVNDSAFDLMKPSVYLVNCSRGPIIDTDALVKALDNRKIAGCALDTTDPEPLPDSHALRGRENVIINPHAAWYSEESMVGLQKGAPNEVKRVLSGEWPVNLVNKKVKESNRAGLS